MTDEEHWVHVDPIPRAARAFQGTRAGVVTRTAAGAVDYALVAAVVIGSYLSIGVLQFLIDPRTFSWPTWSFLTFVLLGWILLFCYLSVAWMTTGRTFGARLMGVRVVSFRGGRMAFGGAIVRSAFCVVFPVGLFWCAVSRQNRSVQDVVLRTSVIHDWNRRIRGGAEQAS